MKLIPRVKRVEVRDGFLRRKEISYKEEALDARLAAALNKLSCDSDGVFVDIRVELECASGDSEGKEGRFDGYELIVDEDNICINSDSTAGAFYAIQTLRQLFEQESVPCLYIKDWADFPHRGFYHDITRGRIPTVETLKKLIDHMAYYKLNALQLYVEHVFEFEETKDLWTSLGYLTGSEMRELDSYCHENFVEFIPSLSTFGHLYELLEQPQYRHLRVLKDYEANLDVWRARMRHHTIDPLNPGSFEMIKSLIDQYAPHFTSEYFNICCDETFDLKHYAEEGYHEGRLYVDFVKKIIDHVRQKNKTVMMWADILLEHPETIAELPENTLFLNWYYQDNVEKIEELISGFAQFGRKQIVCPGTWSWSRFCEKVDREEINIVNMIETGYKYGAVGVLNTNWGDRGNPCSLELGMYGMVLGAEKSWSVNTKVDEAFYCAVNSLLYGSEYGVWAVKAVSELNDRIMWKQVCGNYFAHRHKSGEGMEFISEEAVRQIQEKYLDIRNTLSNASWKNDEYRKEFLIAAEGICVMAELTAKLAGYEIGNEKIRVTNTAQWIDKYSESWLRKNKTSELHRVMEVFLYLQAL